MYNNKLHFPLIFFLLFISLNLLLLDIKIFSDLYSTATESANTFRSPVVETQSYKAANPEVCSQSCTELINKSISQVQNKISEEIQTSPIYSSRIGSTDITSDQTTFILPEKARKEYYIPLGTGYTSKTEWNDATSTETTIDPGNYGGKIVEAYFIASLNNPTQNGVVEAQLFNVTDKHPVWGSLVTMNGPQTQTIQSNQITLSNGNKLYRVQLKSSLGFQISLDNAKIKIITE
jgi:hypothetical protein